MVRPLRVLFPGAFYHLTSRGNNRAFIFRGSADYEDFLDVLEQVVERYGWLCHSYCILGSHYHLLIETPQPNLPAGMRQLNGVFAQRYNRRHARCGHVFQARYKAILVDAESHLMALLRYIAWNPVRAGLCSEPAAWRWSSYPAMLGLTPCPAFLTASWILGHFARERTAARERLSEFVEGAAPTPPPLRAGAYAAGEEFLRAKLGGVQPIEEVRRREWQPVPPSLAEIFASAEKPVVLAHCEYGYTLREIALHLQCHYSTVSRRLRREEAA